MSLHFDRKASSKLRSSFSCRSRTEKERDDRTDPHHQYLKSWSYRQCQFACDYLNLIEPPIQSKHLQKANLNTESGVHVNKTGDLVGGGAVVSNKATEKPGGNGSSCGSTTDNGVQSNTRTNISKLSGNMSAASLGSTVSIPASCVTTSSRSSFNSSILSAGSSDSSSSGNSLYADLFELGYGPSSLLFRVSFFIVLCLGWL